MTGTRGRPPVKVRLSRRIAMPESDDESSSASALEDSSRIENEATPRYATPPQSDLDQDSQYCPTPARPSVHGTPGAGYTPPKVKPCQLFESLSAEVRNIIYTNVISDLGESFKEPAFLQTCKLFRREAQQLFHAAYQPRFFEVEFDFADALNDSPVLTAYTAVMEKFSFQSFPSLRLLVTGLDRMTLAAIASIPRLMRVHTFPRVDGEKTFHIDQAYFDEFSLDRYFMGDTEDIEERVEVMVALQSLKDEPINWLGENLSKAGTERRTLRWLLQPTTLIHCERGKKVIVRSMGIPADLAPEGVPYETLKMKQRRGMQCNE